MFQDAVVSSTSRKHVHKWRHKEVMNIRKITAYLYSIILLLWIAGCESLVMQTRSEQNEFPVHAVYKTANVNINFTHLITDKVSGRVYVGAVNYIYQFNNDLKLEHSFKSGPVKDSPYCSPSDCSSVDPNNIKPTNNVNKVLVIDADASMLIVCGSVHQGSCRRHKLDDIRKAESLIPVPVAANDENSSTVAFIGPARYFGSSTSLALYVAVTNSCLGPYRSEVPAVSSRSLDIGQLFTVIEKSFTDTARVDINFHLRDYYLVKYVYGFHSQNFVYFATVQRKSSLRALEEWGYVTRLARVCDSDSSFHSYAEITIQCISADNVHLNILQAAVVVRVGTNLANRLRVEKGSHVLIGVFAASKDHTTKVSSSSGICVFPLSKIENKFRENILMCYNGTVLTRNMDYIAGSVNECPKAGKTTTAANFCNEAVKLNGSLPLFANAAISYENSTLTSITATTIGQHTVAFVGTSAGAVKKVLLSSETSGEQFEEILVDKGNAILADMVVDSSQKFVFVASPYKVAKIRTETCSQYSTCTQCLSAKNPYCGWCPLKRKCTPKLDCDDGGTWKLTDKLLGSARWLPMETPQCVVYEEPRPQIPTAPPVTTTTTIATSTEMDIQQKSRIDWIHPLSGPVEVGTLVTIDGSNLGSSIEDSTPPVNNVTVNNEIPPLLIGLISATGAFLMLLSFILLAVFRHRREPRRSQTVHSTRRLRRSRRPIADHSQTTHRPLAYLEEDTKSRLRRLADFADITYHSQTTLRPLADFADAAYHTQITLRPTADPSQTTLRPLEDISDDTKNRIRRLTDFSDDSQNTYRANYYYY